MRFYLTASSHRQDELLQYALDLERRGHHVTSRWLCVPRNPKETGLSLAAEARLGAFRDCTDLVRAEACLVFTEPPGSPYSRHERHVDLRMARSWGKCVTIIGPEEHISCALPEVRQYPTWAQFLASLPVLLDDAPSPPD